MKIGRKFQLGGLGGVLLAATALAQAQTKDASAQVSWDSGTRGVIEKIREAREKLVAMAFSAGAAQGQAGAKDVSGQVELKAGAWFRVDGDKGHIEVYPIASGPVTYEVRFQADHGTRPSQQDYDDSSAVYDAAKGLSIRTGKHLEMKVKIGVPAKQPVEVQLETGLVEIGQLTGKIEARVQTGELDYDARALPADVCVNASVNEGSVTNNRDFRCRTGEANLHVHTGTLEVK